MPRPMLLPDPTCLRLSQIETASQLISIVVTTTTSKACCPVCQSFSEHVHSRSVRHVADLPWMGWGIRLELHTRRFFCLNLACSRQIFTERLPNVVAPYARRTTRLTEMLTLIGFVLGGEAGARLAAGMSLPTSPDTLLRLLHQATEPSAPTPRVLGVDDFGATRSYVCSRKDSRKEDLTWSSASSALPD